MIKKCYLGLSWAPDASIHPSNTNALIINPLSRKLYVMSWHCPSGSQDCKYTLHDVTTPLLPPAPQTPCSMRYDECSCMIVFSGANCHGVLPGLERGLTLFLDPTATGKLMMIFWRLGENQIDHFSKKKGKRRLKLGLYDRFSRGPQFLWSILLRHLFPGRTAPISSLPKCPSVLKALCSYFNIQPILYST